MTHKDLPSIVEIDAKLLKRKRPEVWEAKLAQLEKRPSMYFLVAELDGKVVGFIIGDASAWEYRVPDNVGWIDTIGIHPEFQEKGIAKMLMTELINLLKNRGITHINTFVNWHELELLKFFAGSGFERGALLNLELKV
jgi:ribosomal protein S18 acetylase RimI-like enzyme